MILHAALLMPLSAAAGGIAVQSGQRVSFLGDSITQFGWTNPGGYVRLVAAGLKANGIEIEPAPSGTSGNTSRDMLARVSRTLARKPDWLTLSCGVNDVMHGAKGVPLEAYKANIVSIVDQAQAAGARVMILTATPIKEELENEANRKLAAYNDFLRALAVEKKCLLADVNADAQAAIRAAPKPGRLLTVDGVHMNPRGNEVMAIGVLRAFGLDEAQLQKARAAWAEIPDAWAVKVNYPGSSKPKSFWLTQPLTRQEYEQLEAITFQKPKPGSVFEMLRRLYERNVRALLKPDGEYENLDAIYAAGKDREVQEQLARQMNQQIREMLRTGALSK